MIINHSNLIILYDAPQSAISRPPSTQFAPPRNIFYVLLSWLQPEGNWWAFKQITTVHINISFFRSLEPGINGQWWSKVNNNKASVPTGSPFNFYVVKIDREHISRSPFSTHPPTRRATIKIMIFCAWLTESDKLIVFDTSVSFIFSWHIFENKPICETKSNEGSFIGRIVIRMCSNICLSFWHKMQMNWHRNIDRETICVKFWVGMLTLWMRRFRSYGSGKRSKNTLDGFYIDRFLLLFGKQIKHLKVFENFLKISKIWQISNETFLI